MPKTIFDKEAVGPEPAVKTPAQEKLPAGVDPTLVASIRADLETMKARANAVVVNDQLSFTEASKISQQCARHEKMVDERFKDLEDSTKKAKAAQDKVRSDFLALVRSLKEPYEMAKRIIDQKTDVWYKAETKRLAEEAETKRQAEQKRLDAEKAAKVQELAAKGDIEGAAEVAEKPVVAEVATEKVETLKGQTHKPNWKCTCFDLMLLVKAIAEGRAEIGLVEFNQSRGDQLAKAHMEAFKIDGCIAKDVGIVAHKV